MEEVSSSQTSDFDGLTSLGVRSFEHSELEREVSEQVERAIREQREQDASKELRSVEEDIRSVRQRLAAIEKAISMAPRDPAKMTGEARRELQAIRHEKENKRKHLRKIEAKRRALQVCISGGNIQDVGSSTQVDEALGAEVDGDLDQETLVRLREVFAPQETEEERLIRTGQATPFGTRSISIPENTDFDRFLLESAENHAAKKKAKPPRPSPAKPNCIVVKNDKKEPFKFTDLKAAPVKKKRNRLLNIQNGVHKEEPSPKKKKQIERRDLVGNYASDSDVSCHDNNEEDEAGKYSDEDVYIPDEDTSDDEWDEGKKEKKKGGKKGAKSSNSESSKAKSRAKKLVDDGDQASYIKRINKWQLQRKHQRILESPDGVVDSDEEEESVDLEEGLKVPNFIWDKLYTYQHTCVRWLWELHRQECGGILGDEMGLGKTIQVIAFLAALSHSKLREPPSDSFRGLGPVVLVCPTTVMHQWVKEFHTWWPPFRVAILHDSGSFQGKKGSLISMINRACGILVMSYGGLVQHQDRLLAHEWHYIILDEGHKIRNPDAQATIAAKRFRTCHRLLLSGSPIQNHLRELWSLFDFVFPSKLGTLPAFTQHFSVPIVQGGYANASQVQVQTAYKCATVLRDAIRPYLLRRMKSDVNMHINLPSKSEQVLFCKLTEEQVNLYKGYLDSKEVSSILNSKLQIFVGLVNLRKICNHPDLFDGGPKLLKGQDEGSLPEEERYGYPGRSGKMVVVAALLKLWRSQGHRVLLFTQGRQMMEILESFVKSKGYTYMRMDGTTPISTRQPAVQKFNSDPSVFVFLLTTRVGGLGVNLTGADRVLLYDPDWNPSTDAQARERAWRIGQLRSVTVYRLLTAGTIEEKIYHRQIFKQFVSQRVLKDPRQRRFFKSNDLFELFAYSEPGTQGTETSAIFAGTGSLIKPKDTPNPNRKVKEKAATQEINPAEVEVKFSEEKREQMRQLARKLAMQITQGTKNAPPAQCETSTILQPVSANHPSKSPGTKPATSIENAPPAQCETSTILQPVSANNPSKSPETKPATSIEVNSTMKIAKTKELKREHKSPKDKHKGTKEQTPKKSRRKAARVEGEKIEGVVKKSVYRPQTEEDEEKKSKNEDDYVLSKLFKTSGVHTALRHDTIVDSSTPDFSIVESEAQRVADEAVKALRESRRQCRQAQEGVPTPTGRGRAPRFGQSRRLPPGAFEKQLQKEEKKEDNSSKFMFDGKKEKAVTSSAEILAIIRKGKRGGDESNLLENESLIADIRGFVAFQGSVDGRVTTREILRAFKEKVPPDKTALFKALLKKLCTFSREEGEGVWRLKGEFR